MAQKAPLSQSTRDAAIWRFYMTESNAWRWEHLEADRNIVSQSATEHGQYGACLADARDHGYGSTH